LRKKYIYGKATSRYLLKHNRRTLNVENLSRFGLLRPSYLRNVGKIIEDPKLGTGFVVLTISEYLAAAFGAVRGLIGQSGHEAEKKS
jgi:hypothetical protein